jgi:serine protease Do
MKKTHVLSLALVSQLFAIPALAQGSGRDVTILRVGGPQLGVRLAEVNQEEVSRLRLKEEKGALVTEVIANSAAEKAGLLKDDVILKFQGESILTASQLGRLVREVPSGRKVDLEIIRGGAPLKVTATLKRAEWSEDGADFPGMEDLGEKLGKLGDLKFKSGEGLPRSWNFRLDEDSPALMALARSGRGRLGITYTEIEGQLAAYFKAKTSTAILVNSVVEGSAAEKAGLKAGDILVKLGGAAIEDTADLTEAVRDLETGKASPATVLREGRAVDLTVTIEETKRARSEVRRRRPVS